MHRATIAEFEFSFKMHILRIILMMKRKGEGMEMKKFSCMIVKGGFYYSGVGICSPRSFFGFVR